MKIRMFLKKKFNPLQNRNSEIIGIVTGKVND